MMRNTDPSDARAVARRAKVIGIFAAALSLFGAAAHAQSDLDALIKAAKAEGEVVFYSAAVENQSKNTAEAFTAKYGIKAQYVRIGNAPMLQRYAAEVDANNPAADLVVMG